MSKVTNCITSYICKLDFMGFNPQLKIEGESSFKTIFGGLISISIFLLTFAGIIYFGKELFNKREPIALISYIDYDKVGPFKMDNENYNFFVAVEYANYTYYVDPTVFNFIAYQNVIKYDKDGTQNFNSRQLEIDLCNKYYKSNDDINSDVQGLVDIDRFYCLKPGQAEIEGYWGSGYIHSYVGIQLNRCVNSTENNNMCKSNEEIDSITQGGIINMFAKNTLTDLNNLENPVKTHYEDIYYGLNVDITITINMNLRPLEFTSDTGLIFEDNIYISSAYFDSNHVLYFGKRGEIIADVIFQGYALGQRIKRNYSKLQDILTKLGGLTKSLMVIGSFLVESSSKILYYAKFTRSKLINAQSNDEKKDLDDFIKVQKVNNYIIPNIDVDKNKVCEEKYNNTSNMKLKIKEEKQKIEKLKVDLHPKAKIRPNHSVISKVPSFCNKLKTFIFVLFSCKKDMLTSLIISTREKINSELSLESILERNAKISFIFEELCSNKIINKDLFLGFEIEESNK